MYMSNMFQKLNGQVTGAKLEADQLVSKAVYTGKHKCSGLVRDVKDVP